MGTFQKYRKNVYSQHGEDGVIAEIMRRIGLGPNWTCDVGAWDGRYGSNCYELVKRGWPCVMIEAEESKFKYLQQLSRRVDGRIKPVHARVEYTDGPNTLDAILERAQLPSPIQLLSIDIDSYDYHVWRGFSSQRPAVVVIEIGSATLPGERYVYSGGQRLTSFTSMLELGQSKEYTLACHTGNMIFVRNEDAPKLGLTAEELAHPETLFVRDFVNPTRVKRWTSRFRRLTPQRAWVKCVNTLHGNGPA